MWKGSSLHSLWRWKVLILTTNSTTNCSYFYKDTELLYKDTELLCGLFRTSPDCHRGISDSGRTEASQILLATSSTSFIISGRTWKPTRKWNCATKIQVGTQSVLSLYRGQWGGLIRLDVRTEKSRDLNLPPDDIIIPAEILEKKGRGNSSSFL